MPTLLQTLTHQLRLTLTPQFTTQATAQLQSMKHSAGFTSNLIGVPYLQTVEMPVRISALVYLKNVVQEQFKNPSLSLIPPQDMQTLKRSVFPLLIRLTTHNDTPLLPTMKYISFLFCKHLYKQGEWQHLVPELLAHIDQCSSIHSIKATLVVVKILFQILGKSLTEEIGLNNLANRVMLPLVGLAARMFADLGGWACGLLEEVFRILTEAVEFHLPEVVQQNIHVFMVLVKNVLDLKMEEVCIKNQATTTIGENNTNTNNRAESTIRVMRLKRQALIFLQKMYQRHTIPNLSSQQKFVTDFNTKYTRAYFQTIVGIIMGETHETCFTLQESHNYPTDPRLYQETLPSLNFQLITHALGIFSFIASNKEAAGLIQEDLAKYQAKILYLSMERFLSCHSRKLEQKIEACYGNGSNEKTMSSTHTMDSTRSQHLSSSSKQSPFSSSFSSPTTLKPPTTFQNYTDFTQTFRQQRQSLRLFLSTIFTNRNIPNRQQNIQQILQLLLKCITDGSLMEKELALYLLSSLENDIEVLGGETGYSLNQKLVVMLREFVYPLLGRGQGKEGVYGGLIRLRGFEIYRRFEFLEIGQQHSTLLCERIFQQLSSPDNSQLDTFIKIQAIETFNQTLTRDPSLIPKLSSNIPHILRIYTDLLSKDFEVMKFYDQILSLFNPYISPIVHDLLGLLCDMFFKLNEEKLVKFNCLSTGEGRFGNKQSSYQKNDGWLGEGEEAVFDQEEILEEDSDNQTIYEDIKHDYDNIGSQCLASIKKLIFKHQISTQTYEESSTLQEKLLLVITYGLSSKDQTFTRESLAILNLLLYKGYVSQNYHYLLPALLYPIFLTSSPQLANNLSTYAQQHSLLLSNQLSPLQSFPSTYLTLLKEISSDPYSRPFAIFDQIGCLKNFVKVLNKGLKVMVCPILNKTYLEMLVEAVVLVQEVGDSNSYSKSEMLGVLGVGEALIEQRVFDIGGEGKGKREGGEMMMGNSHSLASSYLSQQNNSNNNNSNNNINNPDPYLTTLLHHLTKWLSLLDTPTSSSQPPTALTLRFRAYYFRLILLTLTFYPHQFLTFISRHILPHNYHLSFTSPQYPFDTLLAQIDTFIVQRMITLIKPLREVKDGGGEAECLLNDAYVWLKGIGELIKIVVSVFVTRGEALHFTQAWTRVNLVNARTNGFLSRVFYLMLKLTFYVALLAVKEFNHQLFLQAMKDKQIAKLEKHIDLLIYTPYCQYSQSMSHNVSQHEQDSTDILVGMLQGLGLSTHQSSTQSSFTSSSIKNSRQKEQNSIQKEQTPIQKEQSHHQSLLSPPHHPSPQVTYQQHIKYASTMADDVFGQYSSDQSDIGSDSDDRNPFESTDEEYLYAYDSTILKGVLGGEDRKAGFMRMMVEITGVRHCEEFLVLQRVFPVRL